jgi:hypothetical protein
LVRGLSSEDAYSRYAPLQFGGDDREWLPARS